MREMKSFAQKQTAHFREPPRPLVMNNECPIASLLTPDILLKLVWSVIFLSAFRDRITNSEMLPSKMSLLLHRHKRSRCAQNSLTLQEVNGSLFRTKVQLSFYRNKRIYMYAYLQKSDACKALSGIGE
jgi:hypothetical protein